MALHPEVHMRALCKTLAFALCFHAFAAKTVPFVADLQVSKKYQTPTWPEPTVVDRSVL